MDWFSSMAIYFWRSRQAWILSFLDHLFCWFLVNPTDTFIDVAVDASKKLISFAAGLLQSLEGDMLSFLVQISLAVAEIDDEYFILFLGETGEEVGGRDVVVDESFGVNPLYSV